VTDEKISTRAKLERLADMCWYGMLALLVIVCVVFLIMGIRSSLDPLPESGAIEQTFCLSVLYMSSMRFMALAATIIAICAMGAWRKKTSWALVVVMVVGIGLLEGAGHVVMGLGGMGNSCSAGSVLTT
jgi:hypothetical protein